MLERYDSLYQLLLTGTAPDPDDRFQSAEEMADQLYGVLREVVSDEDGRTVPAASKLFTGPVRGDNERPDWRVLPRPLVDRDDPAAGYLATITSTDRAADDLRPARGSGQDHRGRPAAGRRADRGRRLGFGGRGAGRGRGGRSLGVARRVVSRRDESGEGTIRAIRARASRRSIARCPASSRPSSRSGWRARRRRDGLRGRRLVRDRVAHRPRVHRGHVRPRALPPGGRRAAGALAAYDRVPDSSSAYVEAQTARIRCLVESNGAGAATADDLLVAGSILETLPVRGEQRVRLAADVLESALALVGRGGAFDDGRASLLGYRFAERDLRFGVERSYRELARWAPSSAERIELVDHANEVRPRTWT